MHTGSACSPTWSPVQCGLINARERGVGVPQSWPEAKFLPMFDETATDRFAVYVTRTVPLLLALSDSVFDRAVLVLLRGYLVFVYIDLAHALVFLFVFYM